MGSVFVGLLAFAIVRRHTRVEEEDGRLELVGAGAVGRQAPLTAAVLLAIATTVLAIVVGLFFLYSVPSESLHEIVFERSITGRCTKPLIEHYRERMAARVELDFPEQ